MALKGVIQGVGTGGGGQLSGSGVTSVALSGPAPFITGPPVTSAGTLTFDFSGTPIPVSNGGTGMGSFAPNSLLTAGLTSTGPFQSKPFPGLSSTFLDGTGNFSTPTGTGGGGAGTVTSVDLSPPPEFSISGNPITGAGTLVLGRISPSSVSAGGTGAGNFTSNALIQAGLSSTGAFRSLPLNQQTSTFLDGTGTFRIIPYPPAGAGTVTSVDLALSSEFTVSGNPITGAGQLVVGFVQPLSIAHGGTGLGSFGVGAIVRGGLTSTGPLQGLPLTNLTSNFLRGDGVFAAGPAGPGGTVTSVGLSAPAEFTVQNTPIIGAGTLALAYNSPTIVPHGGTGMGSFAANSIMQMGPTSTAPMTSIVLPNLTSSYLRGDGVFAPTPVAAAGGGSGTVTSVALQMSSEFNVTGSPVTTGGTLMASWAFQSANFLFGGPGTGPAGTPAFRALVNADIPQSMGGKTMSSSTFQNANISSQILTFGSSIKWNMNSGSIGLLGMDSTVFGTMDTPSNVRNTGSAILRITQLGTGLPNLAWNNFWKFEAVGGVRTPPTLSSGFSNIDVISLYMESTHAYGVARKNFT